MIEDEKIKAENEKKLRELAQAFKRLFATKDGKIVKKDLEKFCNRNKSSVCEHNPNALQTHFEEGKRRVILRIDSMINRREENDV